jgi:hypothetical protein
VSRPIVHGAFPYTVVFHQRSEDLSQPWAPPRLPTASFSRDISNQPLEQIESWRQSSARLRPVNMAKTRFSRCIRLLTRTPTRCPTISTSRRFARTPCSSSTHTTPQ